MFVDKYGDPHEMTTEKRQEAFVEIAMERAAMFIEDNFGEGWERELLTLLQDLFDLTDSELEMYTELDVTPCAPRITEIVLMQLDISKPEIAELLREENPTLECDWDDWRTTFRQIDYVRCLEGRREAKEAAKKLHRKTHVMLEKFGG